MEIYKTATELREAYAKEIEAYKKEQEKALEVDFQDLMEQINNAAKSGVTTITRIGGVNSYSQIKLAELGFVVKNEAADSATSKIYWTGISW